MKLRSIETGLSWFTICLLLIYAPVETWASIDDGLLNPFYIVDVIAMVLLFAGALVSLRARPDPAPGLLCAAYGWTAANGWRATFGRIFELRRGGQLDHGTAEIVAVAIGEAIAMICFVVTLCLVIYASAWTRKRDVT
jgi:hypothetical protein